MSRQGEFLKRNEKFNDLCVCVCVLRVQINKIKIK